MKSKIILIAIAMLSLSAFSQTEHDVACDLERAKAEVMAATVESPYLYGSVSNDPSNKGVTVGAGYSLSGRSKGKLIRDSANAKCSALAATLQLDDQQRWVLLSINKIGARTELQELLEARSLINDQLSLFQRQLKAQTISLNEYNSARSVQASIETKIDSLRTVLSQPTLPVNINNVRGLLETARVNLTKAAELDSKIQAESNWDVSAVVGGRKEINSFSYNSEDKNGSGQTTPFVGITFRWSFGGDKANSAVKAVRDKTEQLFNVSRMGYAQSIDRLVSQISDAQVIDKDRETLLTSQLNETLSILSSLNGVETALALNTRRNLQIQSKILKAELDGVKKRLSEYNNFLSKI